MSTFCLLKPKANKVKGSCVGAMMCKHSNKWQQQTTQPLDLFPEVGTSSFYLVS